MNERQKLLRRIQMYGFAIYDAGLFLDTHPDNQDALAYFRKYRRMLKDVMMEYINKYGPLTSDDLPDNATRWTWVDEPWPWEVEV